MTHSGDAPPTTGPPVRFATLLLRSVRTALVLLVLLIVSLAAGPVDVSVQQPDTRFASLWKDAWSRQFPGCVSLALWPPDEPPEAYLLKTGDGQPVRVEAERGRVSGTAIGACRSQ